MSKESKKILVSGVKPTGRLHIGNYFGAMKQFVDLQETYESYIFIADYHAMTTVQNREELKQGIIDIALDYLAVGLDPKKVTLFKQSDVPQVAELTWIFNSITTIPYLMRAHAFKAQVDKVWSKYMDERGLKTLDEYVEARKKDSPKFDDEMERMFSGINTGILDYPILMAADILIQDADLVPVGQDQKQHIEYARDIAQKFNKIYGDTFKLPKELIDNKLSTKAGIIIGTDGFKMSKSRNNIIPLFATDEEIRKSVMGIVTDSGASEPINVSGIHYPIRKALFEREMNEEKATEATANFMKDLYQGEKRGKYKELKEALITDMIAFIKPMREKREMLAQDMETVFDILKEGGKRASARAEKKMKEVREKVGLEIY